MSNRRNGSAVRANAPTRGIVALNRWEAGVRNEIVAHVRSDSAIPLVRLHFLAHAGAVYFIDTPRWWHSLLGDAHKIARRLRADNVRVVRVVIGKSDALWVPYFGRTQDEEPNRGWCDPSIELRTVASAANARMQAAWQLLKAHRSVRGHKDNVRI
jgi:hypothetical protein